MDSPAAHPNLPPGFRFHPTDEELVIHYLKRKANSVPLPVTIIAEIDLYKFDPWELPSKASFGEHEWYFFSPRDQKYPNGARPNRAAISGYWKATGTDKPVLTSNGAHKVGVKKALVFYGGKPPKGVKTNWIMHEYRLFDSNNNNNNTSNISSNKKPSLRLDDWVLCRIFYKKNNATQGLMISESDKDDHSVVSRPPRSSGLAALLGSEEGLFDAVSSPLSPRGTKRAVTATSFWNDEGKRFCGGVIDYGGSSGNFGGGATDISNTAPFQASAMFLGSNTSQFQLPTDMGWNT